MPAKKKAEAEPKVKEEVREEIRETEAGREGVSFKAIKIETIDFGKNKFLEISRKEAVTAEGANEFINISRGFYTKDTKSKRFTSSVAMPMDKGLVEKVAKALKDVL